MQRSLALQATGRADIFTTAAKGSYGGSALAKAVIREAMVEEQKVM
jgi:hypothetical protein